MGKKKESKPLIGKQASREKQHHKQEEAAAAVSRRLEQEKSSGGSSSSGSAGSCGAGLKVGKNMKKGGGGGGKSGKVSSVTIRPKLASVHETSAELDDSKMTSRGGGNGGGGGDGKCLDDIDENQRRRGGGDDDQGEVTGSIVDEANKSCPMYFGVKSYLHHFYETVNQHPNTPGTEEDFLYLIHPKGRKCGALWFKTGLIIGATLFLLGAIAIVIGYAIPKQDAVVGRNEDFEIVDKDAVRFNKNLDICKLIGLAGFCSGGLVLVISLLAPTFTNTYWDEDPTADPEPFRVSLSSSLIYEAEPKSPIPVTEKIKCIQPTWSD